MLIGFLLLLFAVLLNVAFWCALRFGVMRAVGVRTGGLVAALGFDHQPWIDVPRSKRTVFAIAGPVASYLCSSVLMTVGFLFSGDVRVDETSMRVNVSAAGPAAEAGFQKDDRILKVEEEPITSWNQLRTAVARRAFEHPNQPMRVEVDRAGRIIVLTPTPSSAGKIGVAPAIDHEGIGFGGAVAKGLIGPIDVWASLVRALSRKPTPTEFTGPVGVVKETGSAQASAGLGTAFKLIGALSSYFILIPIIAAIALFPRARRRPVG